MSAWFPVQVPLYVKGRSFWPQAVPPIVSNNTTASFFILASLPFSGRYSFWLEPPVSILALLYWLLSFCKPGSPLHNAYFVGSIFNLHFLCFNQSEGFLEFSLFE